jgi:hypothetical protein
MVVEMDDGTKLRIINIYQSFAPQKEINSTIN